MFFSLDGLDGVGKTTQLDLFCAWLGDKGREVVRVRDPGGTPLGERIRGLLLESDDAQPISPRSEMLLYMAARAQLVDEVIAPARAAGKVVVSDRFLLANVVYQGHAGGLDVDLIWTLGRFATNDIAPDLTFLLDMPPEAAQRRISRDLDRMERRGEEYRRRLREGFLAEADRDPKGIFVIDARRTIDQVQAEIRTLAAAVLAAD